MLLIKKNASENIHTRPLVSLCGFVNRSDNERQLTIENSCPSLTIFNSDLYLTLIYLLVFTFRGNTLSTLANIVECFSIVF